jgi:hypothetical protein
MRFFQPIIILVLILTACHPQAPSETQISSSQDIGISPTAEYFQCGWIWATQPLPEVDARLKQALQASNLAGWQASAQAFGENCLNNSGQVDHFAARDLDFRFQVQATDLSDLNELGSSVERIMGVLDQIEIRDSEPQPGTITIRFLENDEELNMNFKYSECLSLLSQGLHGADLFQALRKQQ